MIVIQDWRMSRNPITRDVAWIVGGIVGAGALIGVGIGIVVDVLMHRHRRPT